VRARRAATVTLAVALGVGLVATPGARAEDPTATVTHITYSQGSSAIDVVLAVPRSVDDDARNHRAAYSVLVAVTYLSINSALETVGSDWVPLVDTVLIANDNDTASILVRAPLGNSPPPGGNPNFTATVDLSDQTAIVTGITYAQGSSAIDVVLAIPRSVDEDARTQRAAYDLRVTVTYLTDQGTGETVDSGWVPGIDTVLVSNDIYTASVLLQAPLGNSPPPGGNPNFTATVDFRGPTTTVADISYTQGSSSIDVLVTIPRSVDDDARNRIVDWGLQVRVTYVTDNGTVETVDSGRVAIRETTFISSHNDRALILLRVPIGSTPPPAGTPGYTSRIALLEPTVVDRDSDGIVDTAPPTDKAQCKHDGWMSFNNPSFDNPGGCARYVKARTS
jgi:hypothetical protein